MYITCRIQSSRVESGEGGKGVQLWMDKTILQPILGVSFVEIFAKMRGKNDIGRKSLFPLL